MNMDMIILFYLMISDDNTKHFFRDSLINANTIQNSTFCVQAQLLNIEISVVKIHIFLGT